MFYYDRHSTLNYTYDPCKDEFRLCRLFHESPDSLGYLPSYRNLSVIAPDFLNPLSASYWQRPTRTKYQARTSLERKTLEIGCLNQSSSSGL